MQGRDGWLRGVQETRVPVLIVLVAKFTSGAWITALLVPAIIWMMHAIKRHYCRINEATAENTPLRLTDLLKPVVVIPVARWDKIAEKAVRFGMVMSEDVKIVTVETDTDSGFDDTWEHFVMKPIREHEGPVPELVEVQSTYRTVISPLMDYILKLETVYPGRKIAVLLPELVVHHWWENLLHNQRTQVLKLLLLLKGNRRIVVVNIPWYL